MIIIVKNAITGGIIGVAHSAREAIILAEQKRQPYIFEVKEAAYG